MTEKLTMDNAVLTCVHVLEKKAKPEYHTEDDSYVCSSCRDLHDKEKDLDLTGKYLKMVHRRCLIE